jgi:ParB-like chromosome segregation protein Spo0J
MAKKATKATKPSSPTTDSPDSPDSPQSPAGSLPPLTRFQGFEAVTIDRRQIVNADYNPRQITPAQRRKLGQSIKRFKLVESLVWNVRTGNLVGGHQRISLIDDYEGKDAYSITVSKIDVDEATEKAINIALNNPEAQGQYDYELLASLVENINATSPQLVSDAGFDPANLSQIFGDDFLVGPAADQARDDADTLATLDEMYQAGADADKAAKAAKAANSPNRPLPANMANASGGEGDDADDSPDSTDSADPADASPDGPDTPPDGYGKAGWTKQDFKDRRREFREQKNVVDQANVFLTLAFVNAEQLGTFLAQYGHSQELDMIDAGLLIGSIEHAHGIDLDFPQVNE